MLLLLQFDGFLESACLVYWDLVLSCRLFKFASAELCYKPLGLNQRGRIESASVSWFKESRFLS